MKPLLLLDVDGPLNPFAAKATRRPDGYETHRPTPAGWSKPIRVWLNPEHGPMLLRITNVVDLTWATTWTDQANVAIGPMIGLPRLPVIQVKQPSWGDRGKHIWKLDAVKEYVGNRSFAWFDDDFTKADLEWAAKRTADGFPTLFVPIDPAIGIVQGDVDRVAAWAWEVPRVVKQRCEQCGRVGVRGFRTFPDEDAYFDGQVVAKAHSYVECASKNACRKR